MPQTSYRHAPSLDRTEATPSNGDQLSVSGYIANELSGDPVRDAQRCYGNDAARLALPAALSETFGAPPAGHFEPTANGLENPQWNGSSGQHNPLFAQNVPPTNEGGDLPNPWQDREKDLDRKNSDAGKEISEELNKEADKLKPREPSSVDPKQREHPSPDYEHIGDKERPPEKRDAYTDEETPDKKLKRVEEGRTQKKVPSKMPKKEGGLRKVWRYIRPILKRVPRIGKFIP